MERDILRNRAAGVLDFALRGTEIEYLCRNRSKSLVGEIVRLDGHPLLEMF